MGWRTSPFVVEEPEISVVGVGVWSPRCGYRSGTDLSAP